LVAHSDGGEWVDVAKTSKLKTNRGGKKYASRVVENGVAKVEQVSDHPQAGRALQVPLITNGQIATEYLGIQGASLAREHHKMAISELPAGALRLSRGEPAIPVEFI
jgi:nicotinate phosphoribosyltransferase